jgi:hypothetical protein
LGLRCRVARWFCFRPKIAIWVNFGASCNGSCWYISWTLGLFCGYSIYFMAIRYILWPFGIFYGHWVYLWFIFVVYFSPFWNIVPRKIWQPCFRRLNCPNPMPQKNVSCIVFVVLATSGAYPAYQKLQIQIFVTYTFYICICNVWPFFAGLQIFVLFWWD